MQSMKREIETLKRDKASKLPATAVAATDVPSPGKKYQVSASVVHDLTNSKSTLRKSRRMKEMESSEELPVCIDDGHSSSSCEEEAPLH